MHVSYKSDMTFILHFRTLQEKRRLEDSPKKSVDRKRRIVVLLRRTAQRGCATLSLRCLRGGRTYASKSRKIDAPLQQQADARQRAEPLLLRILLRARIVDLISTNAVSFSSARTTKRFPSPRCASAIQIVRASEPMAEKQPNSNRLC